jgi:hypothetical protein
VGGRKKAYAAFQPFPSVTDPWTGTLEVLVLLILEFADKTSAKLLST